MLRGKPSDDLPRNAMHWCEYCRVWTQPDFVSIKGHENGSKHQESVRQFLLNQKKRKTDEERSKAELSSMLARMESAAVAGLQKDVRSGAFSGSSYASAAALQATSMSVESMHATASTSVGRSRGALVPNSSAGSAVAVAALPHVQQQTYHRGVAPRSPELPIPADAAFASNTAPPVPPMPPPPPPPPPPEDATAPLAATAVVEVPSAVAVAPIDETTGLGAWQTISASETEARERAREEAAEAAVARDVAAVAGRKRRYGDAGGGGSMLSSSAHAGGAGEDDDDAYAAFNPYGGKYRGIDLDAECDANAAAAAAAAAGSLERQSAPACGMGVPAAESSWTDATLLSLDGSSATAVPPVTDTATAATDAEGASAYAAAAPIFKKRLLKPGQRLRGQGNRGDDD